MYTETSMARDASSEACQVVFRRRRGIRSPTPWCSTCPRSFLTYTRYVDAPAQTLMKDARAAYLNCDGLLRAIVRTYYVRKDVERCEHALAKRTTYLEHVCDVLHGVLERCPVAIVLCQPMWRVQGVGRTAYREFLLGCAAKASCNSLSWQRSNAHRPILESIMPAGADQSEVPRLLK